MADHVRINHLCGQGDGVLNGQGVGRTVADHAHTLDAQQNRPAIGVRVELLVLPVEFRPEHPGRFGGLLAGRHGGKQRGHQGLQAPLQGL